MVEKEKKVRASPAMGKRRAENLRARDCSPGGQSLARIGNTSANSKHEQCAAASNYKGVRMREWGKWVTETSDPQTKKRVWIGSFDTEEMAARAYDSAVVSLKGPNAAGLNFPDSPPRFVSQSRLLKDIQAAAARAAADVSAPEATPLVCSKKKKVSSSLSTCDSHTQGYTPDQGEPSAPQGSGRAATLEEIHNWIENDFCNTYSGPVRPRDAATGMESYTGIASIPDGYPGTYPYLEVYDRLSYMPYEEDFPYLL